MVNLADTVIHALSSFENVLSTSITLKKEVRKPGAISLEVANKLREKYRSYTLGNAVNLIRNENLFSESLFKTMMCLVCGWIYSEKDGAPSKDLAPGTRWEDIPDTWTRPEYGVKKEDFTMVEV